MVLNNIHYHVFRKKQITSQNSLALSVVLTESATGMSTFSSLAELNYNSSSDISDPELLAAIQKVGTDITAWNAIIQTFITGISTTRDYSDNEAALDAFKTALQTTDSYLILKSYIDYHVTSLTDNASDYLSYSKDDWSLIKLNNSLFHSTVRRDFERINNLLQRLATLLSNISDDALYQSINSLQTQLNTTLSSIQLTTNSISTLIYTLENGIETTLTDVASVKTKFAQVSTNLAECSVRLGLMFTGGPHSLDKTS